MQRKFSITGTDDLEGDYPLIFTIFDDNGAQVATASTTLKIVEDLPEEKKSFSLLTIGDSLSCNTATYERLNELTDNKIIYMGTRGVGGSLMEEMCIRDSCKRRRIMSSEAIKLEHITKVYKFCLLYTSRCV